MALLVGVTEHVTQAHRSLGGLPIPPKKHGYKALMLLLWLVVLVS